jgi:putative transposase
MPRTRKPKPTDVFETVLDPFAGPARPMSQGEVDVITKRFKKALVERMLGGQLTHHLGYPPGGEKPPHTANHRNGTSGGSPASTTRILALYARGLTVREIQAFLAEMYAVEVSPDFINTVTDAVHAEVTARQARPLEPMYPRRVLRCASRRDPRRGDGPQQGRVPGPGHPARRQPRHPGHLAEQTEGAKFWMKVFTDLKTRGCQDILIAVTDGLKGMSEALAASHPATTLQTCIVHRLRHSLDFAN